jgi:GNAT superfamily N-acetyltransferase
MPATGATARAVVRGNSMEPAVRNGDVLTVERRGSEPIRTGDIVSFLDDRGNVVSHRVLGRESPEGRPVVITQGDGRTEPDSPWDVDRLIGVVTAAERLPARLLRRLLSLERLAWWELGEIVATRARAARALRALQRRLHRAPLTIRQERRTATAGEWLAVTCTATDERGDAAGWLTVVRERSNGDTAPSLWLLFGLQVRLRFRGLGLGRRLVTAAEHAVGREGGGRLYAFVRPHNRPSVGLFESNGWRAAPPPAGTLRAPELASCLCFIKDV